MSRIDRTPVANMLMGQARGLLDVVHILCHQVESRVSTRQKRMYHPQLNSTKIEVMQVT